jgi:hypothetical protein
MFACGGEALIEIDDGGALQVNCRFDIASSP